MFNIIKTIVQISIVVKVSAFFVLLMNAIISLFVSLLMKELSFLDVFQSPFMIMLSILSLIVSSLVFLTELSSESQSL